MVNPTLRNWQEAVTNIIVSSLPLQTFDSASILVNDYLSSTGGWDSDDPNDSNGPGQPSSGLTIEETVAEIIKDQMEKIYRIQYNVNLNLALNGVANLDSGLSNTAIITALNEKIKTFIVEQLEDTNLSIVSFGNITGTIVENGFTTRSQRTSYNIAANSPVKTTDPVVLALKNSRSTYNLDSKWNVFSIYNELDSPIVVTLKKYETGNYLNVDQSVNYYYTVYMSIENYKLLAGIKILT